MRQLTNFFLFASAVVGIVFGSVVLPTSAATAAMMLTQRNGARVPVPRGNITLGIRKSDSTMDIDSISI